MLAVGLTCGVTEGALGAVGSAELGPKKLNPDFALSLIIRH